MKEMDTPKTIVPSVSPAVVPEGDVSTRLISKLRGIPCAGIALAMLSGMFFATAGFIVKLIPDVNPIQIVVCRSIVQFVIYFPVILMGRMPLMGARGERVNLLLRGIFGFTAFTLCYISYRMIPLADASTIVFSSPVYVSVFACIILKEECGIFQTFTIGMTIAGVLLISKPTFLFGMDHESVVQVALRVEGTVTAFVSSLCTAITFVMMRRLQRTQSAVVISWFSVVSIILGILTLTIIQNYFVEEAGLLAEGVGIPASHGEICWLVANGLCGVFGQLCLTVSLKIEEAGLVSLARTIDIVMAFLFQVAFLHNEVVHWTSVVGAVIVCTGVGISGLRRWLKSKPGKCNTLWLVINCGVKRPEDDDPKSPARPPSTYSGTSIESHPTNPTFLRDDKPIKLIIEEEDDTTRKSEQHLR